MTTQERILRALARDPSKSDRLIAKNTRATAGEVAALRSGTPAEPKPPQGGIPLSKLRVLPRKPADSAAVHIRKLPTGRGFDPRELADQWGMSEDTVRRHAKDLKCLKFVEVSQDEWVALIMNPLTAANYHA